MLVESTLGKKAVTAVQSKLLEEFKTFVANTRARVYFETFTRHLQQEFDLGVETSEVDACLKQLLSTERGKELLHDAYRRVCLSASRELGPKIIAIQTVKLLKEERWANDLEEMIFGAAEVLKDADLRWFAMTFAEAKNRTHTKLADIALRNQNEIRLYTQGGPGLLPVAVSRLLGLGIVRIDVPSSPLQQRSVISALSMGLLVELINRATGPANN